MYMINSLRKKIHRVIKKTELKVQLRRFFKSNQKLIFNHYPSPELSVIIIVHNQAQYTLECLKILKNQQNVFFEIIIIDNASNDDTSKLLNNCSNIKVINNSKNIGFIKASNQATKYARGNYLLFLNNDIWYLNEDALACGLGIIKTDKSIGALSGKIIFSKTIMQEAGVIVHRDSSRRLGYSYTGYGCHDSPSKFEFNFQRQVDGCSGVFLLTPKLVFEKIGRFDNQFAPAYCEDIDYCLRLNYLDLKVIYDPRIIVGHIGHGSRVFLKKKSVFTQKDNRAIFYSKHEEWIKKTALLSRFKRFSTINLLSSRHYNRKVNCLLFVGDLLPSTDVIADMKKLCDVGYFVSYYPEKKLTLSWQEIYKQMDIRIEICQHKKLTLNKFLQQRKNFYHKIIYV